MKLETLEIKKGYKSIHVSSSVILNVVNKCVSLSVQMILLKYMHKK